jgi:hypothetical protein
MDTLTPQIQEVLRLMKTYVGVCERAKQAHRTWRVSELNLLKVRVARLARLVELKQKLQARRLQLTMEHPYGFMKDLGYPLSDEALEGMHRAQDTASQLNLKGELMIDSPNNWDSLLANPEKMAALTRAAYE